MIECFNPKLPFSLKHRQNPDWDIPTFLNIEDYFLSENSLIMIPTAETILSKKTGLLRFLNICIV